MNVLIACEASQEVCKAFREKGHTAFSCDIEKCYGGRPEWHIRGDALKIINGRHYGKNSFATQDGTIHLMPYEWDLIIAHPPCTYLANSGNRWFSESRYGQSAIERKMKRADAVQFFMEFVNAPCGKIAIENPIGHMSAVYRKPDQIIQPYQFGDHARKATCLWLKGLPNLVHTGIVDPGIIMTGGYSSGAHADGRVNGRWLRFNDPELSRARSKTFPGIAKAMADQWG